MSDHVRGGRTNVIHEPAIPQSTYQQALNQGLEPPPLTKETVRYWSDYNRVFYHPQSIVQLQEYELNSTMMPFERWDTGEELFSNLDKEHDLLDRDLRPFLEESDQLQGLQILTSTYDAWGGFAARYLDRIRDDLGKSSVWVWAIEEGGRKSRVCTTALRSSRETDHATANHDVTYGQRCAIDIPDLATGLDIHTHHYRTRCSAIVHLRLRCFLEVAHFCPTSGSHGEHDPTKSIEGNCRR